MNIDMAGSEWFLSRPGGLNRYFQSLYQALSADPHTTVSAAAFGEPPQIPGARSWGRMGSGLARRILQSRRLPPSITPDIVDRHFCLYGAPARAYASRPVQVIHFQGPWAAESELAGGHGVSVRVKRAIEKSQYLKGDHFVVLSRAFKATLAGDYGIEEDRISIIPPGVDLDRFSLNPEPAHARPRVLCVRRLERRMGIHVLIEAWQEVHVRMPEAILTIVGTGTFEQQLRAQAAASEASSSIEFLGRLGDAELTRAYRDCTITVVPTIALEGFGLIALESLASGRVPIITDCGGLPDSVAGFDPSLIVPAGSVEALGSRMLSALAGRRPSAEEARRHAETFAWPLIAERHTSLYGSLLG